MTTAEATLTEFLRDPNAVAETLSLRDVVLHRRNAEDILLSLRSRADAEDEAIALVARLLTMVVADQRGKALLAEAAASIPWVTFLPDKDRDQFVLELLKTAEGAAELGSMAGLRQLIAEWKATAAVHSDPGLALELKRPIEDIGARVVPPSAG